MDQHTVGDKSLGSSLNPSEQPAIEKSAIASGAYTLALGHRSGLGRYIFQFGMLANSLSCALYTLAMHQVVQEEKYYGPAAVGYVCVCLGFGMCLVWAFLAWRTIMRYTLLRFSLVLDKEGGGGGVAETEDTEVPHVPADMV